MRSVVESGVADTLADFGGVAEESAIARLEKVFGGIYFAPGTKLRGTDTAELVEEIYGKALETYEKKEAAYGEHTMRELERVIMLRVVDEYWMENIDAMDDLKQGIGLRAYGQHDPVIAYKEEGYEMFQAMVRAIREETVRRLFLVQLRPRQEVKRERVAKETGTGAAVNAQVKKQPVRKDKKAGPNDPCPCGSGKKYKKCCMQKDKMAE